MLNDFKLQGVIRGTRVQTFGNSSATFLQLGVTTDFKNGGSKEEIHEIKLSDYLITNHGIPAKGSKVTVSGSISSKEWKDKTTGATKYFTELFGKAYFGDDFIQESSAVNACLVEAPTLTVEKTPISQDDVQW